MHQDTPASVPIALAGVLSTGVAFFALFAPFLQDPSAQALTSENAMLPPITTAGRRSLRHTHAMTQTTNPQETPRSAAVASSRRNADASQSQVTLTERKA